MEMNAEDERDETLLTALTTEHFVLQTSSAATISEGSSRSSIFLLSVSTSMVALGFTTGNPGAFGPMATVILPTLFVLGWFTIVRLTDTSVENFDYLRRMACIRLHYGGLSPAAAKFFPTTEEEAQGPFHGTGSPRTRLLFTMASMIGVVTAVIGGAGLALLLDLALRVPRTGAVLAGVALAVLLAMAAVEYQQRRFGHAFDRSRPSQGA